MPDKNKRTTKDREAIFRHAEGKIHSFYHKSNKKWNEWRMWTAEHWFKELGLLPPGATPMKGDKTSLKRAMESNGMVETRSKWTGTRYQPSSFGPRPRKRAKKFDHRIRVGDIILDVNDRKWKVIEVDYDNDDPDIAIVDLRKK